MSRYILRAESASRQLVHRFSSLNGSGFSQMKVSPVATFFLPAACLLASSPCHAFVAGTNTHHAFSTTQQRKMSSTALGSKPFAVVVQVSRARTSERRRLNNGQFSFNIIPQIPSTIHHPILRQKSSRNTWTNSFP